MEKLYSSVLQNDNTDSLSPKRLNVGPKTIVRARTHFERTDFETTWLQNSLCSIIRVNESTSLTILFGDLWFPQ